MILSLLGGCLAHTSLTLRLAAANPGSGTVSYGRAMSTATETEVGQGGLAAKVRGQLFLKQVFSLSPDARARESVASSWNSGHTVTSTARLSLGSPSLALLSRWPWGPGESRCQAHSWAQSSTSNAGPHLLGSWPEPGVDGERKLPWGLANTWPICFPF